MLQVTKGPLPHPEDSESEHSTSLTETIRSLSAIVRRQLPVFVLLMAGAVLLGVLYLITTPPSFTATATMVIDTRKVQLFQQQSVLGDIAIDAGTVQTQVEVLKSENISLSVIRDLHLAEDPEFTGRDAGLIGAIFGSISTLLGTDTVQSEAALQRRTLAVFEKRRTVNRVGLTYVMEINFRSYDPDKAARIANAIADAYVVDQLEAKYQATKRASIWLQERIQDLRTQATSAERAVVNFKQSNNMVDTGGRLMNEQNLSEVNSQAILAHAKTAEAKARLDNINQIMKQAIPDGSVADALKSEVIIQLRNRYLEIASKEAIWANKYGPNHLATMNLRSQMQEIRKNISDQMAKIAESYRSDYEVALARENAIKDSLGQTISESQVTGQAQIQLRELESNSQTYRAMYDNFLQRYMEAVQQQSFPITEARIISAASRPLHRSQPNTGIVLAITCAGGLMLSFGTAFAREMADRVFRSATQVENKLRVNCIATVPATQFSAPAPKADPASTKVSALFQPAAGQDAYLADSSAADTSKPPSQHQAQPENERIITAPASLLRYVLAAPFSQFTEAHRSIKVAIDLNGAVSANKIIGVTSSLPNEGKTTTSANLASLIAHAGARAILIDADLRNPSLSRNMAEAEAAGLVDVLAGRVPLESVLWKDPQSGLSFLPVGNASKLTHTHEILGSEQAKKLFADLRNLFDYIIVDLAPLAPVVDTRTSVNFIDSYIYVVEWGRTKIDVAVHSLTAANEVYDRLLGVVLNKVDMSVLGRYERYRSNYYYKKYYSRYRYTA